MSIVFFFALNSHGLLHCLSYYQHYPFFSSNWSWCTSPLIDSISLRCLASYYSFLLPPITYKKNYLDKRVKIIPNNHFQHGGLNHSIFEHHKTRSVETALSNLGGHKIVDMEIRVKWPDQESVSFDSYQIFGLPVSDISFVTATQCQQ